MNTLVWLLVLSCLACKPRQEGSASLTQARATEGADQPATMKACSVPKPVVLFMPGCGFASCGSEAGSPWLMGLRETLDGIVPPSSILLVPYEAAPFPNTGQFAAAVKAAMVNRCYSKVITAGASAGDTIGSLLVTRPNDYRLPRPIDAHIGLYGPKQFLYYKQNRHLQGVENDAGAPISALKNLEAYAGGSSNRELYMASPQTYANPNNATRVFTSMGTLDRRINKDTGELFFQALGGSRKGFNVLHTCIGGGHGYHFNGNKGMNPTDAGGAAFGGGSCPDLRARVRAFVCDVIGLHPCPE